MYISLAEADLLQFDHWVFGSHWRWQSHCDIAINLLTYLKFVVFAFNEVDIPH